ncbi:MAG: cell division protein PerM [Micromonosporaceae bacterium]
MTGAPASAATDERTGSGYGDAGTAIDTVHDRATGVAALPDWLTADEPAAVSGDPRNLSGDPRNAPAIDGARDDVPEEAEQQTTEPVDGIPADVDHPSQTTPPQVAGHPDSDLSYHQEPATPVNPSPERPDTRGHRPAGSSRRTGPAPKPRAGSMLVAAAATGGWAATVSFAPLLAAVLLAWIGSSAVSGGTAVRFAVTTWLLGHGVPFTAPHGQVGLVPLGITALVVWRLVRAGAHTARAVAATPRDVPYVVGALAGTYGLIGCVAGIAADTEDFAIVPWQALLITGLVGGLASLPGALAETGAAPRIWQRCSDPVREGVRGGVLAALWILAAGAGLAGLATAIAYQDAVDLYRGYGVGVGGGAGITLVGLLYAPNLAIWGASYLVGPGFAVGVDTGVTGFDVSLGALPAVPVLAGLPTGPAPAAVGVLLAVPVLVAVLVGVGTARRRPDMPWPSLFTASGLTGAVAAVVLGASSFAASGPLGSGQLARIGPTWWLVGLVAVAVVAGGAALAGASARALGERRPD